MSICTSLNLLSNIQYINRLVLISHDQWSYIVLIGQYVLEDIVGKQIYAELFYNAMVMNMSIVG